jgi:signal transduction histidine kinase
VLDAHPRGAVFPALVVAFWTAMLAGHRALGWLSVLAGYLAFVVVVPATGAQPAPSLAWATGLAAWMLLLGATAEVVRARRERAHQSALARSEQERREAGDERLRIARELHDVLAHNISLINVQAGVALHLVDQGRPEHTRAALEAITAASKEALGELRSALELLRHPDRPAPRLPASRLATVPDLMARTRASGLKVSTSVRGRARPLAPDVDLAAYRIVQESLTNVARHAPGAATAVRLTYGERDLVVEVDSAGEAGAAPNGDAPGSAIAGMRERAAALGGTLDAGPQAAGGFRVHARLPTDRPG